MDACVCRTPLALSYERVRARARRACTSLHVTRRLCAYLVHPLIVPGAPAAVRVIEVPCVVAAAAVAALLLLLLPPPPPLLLLVLL